VNVENNKGFSYDIIKEQVTQIIKVLNQKVDKKELEYLFAQRDDSKEKSPVLSQDSIKHHRKLTTSHKF